MTLQDLGFTSPWPLVLLVLGIGFVLGWLITGLPPRSKLAKVQSHAQELDASLNQTKASLAEATAQVTALQRESAALTTQVNALQGEVTVAHQHETELTAALTGTRADLDKAGAQVDSLQQASAAREAELTDLKLQQAALRTAAQQSYGTLNADNQSLQAEVARLSEENQNLKINLEGTAKDLAKSRAEVETVAQAISNKDAALGEAYARAVRLERESTDEQGQLLSQQAELETLKRNLAMMSAANEESNRRLENARGEVAGELAALTSTMLRIKDEQLAQANGTITALQAQLAAVSDRSVPG
jgi:chromosome segregation ATPase